MARTKVKDWVERGDDFVHRGKVRSGWDEDRKSMTDYLLGGEGPRSAEGQIKEVYRLCRNRADILADGKNINVLFSPEEETGRTDGKKVLISTRVMDEKKTFAEKCDIMLGITTHEMAHIMHTDFPMAKRMIKNRFVHSIWNTVEDERIEHMVGEDTPGYSHSIKSIKEYFFNEKYLLDKALKEGKTMKAHPEGPPATDELEGKSRSDKTSADDEDEEDDWDSSDDDAFLPKTKEKKEEDGIPDHLIADDTRDRVLTEEMADDERKAMELSDLIFKFIRYPKYIDPEVASRHETALDDIKEILTPYPTTTGEAITAATKVAGVIRKHLEDDIPDIDKMLEKIGDMLSGPDGSSTDSINEDGEPKEGDISDSVDKYDYTDEHIEDVQWKAVFRKGVPQPETYHVLLGEVRGDAARLASVLNTKVYSETKLLKGMRSGALDDGKLVDAIAGSRTIHTHRIEKVSKRINLTVLLDESGSMGGSKARDAAKVGILLEEAYRIFPVGQLFIYGFTGDYGDDFNTVIRYKEPGLDVRCGLGDVQGRSENRDGHCIRAVARRVRTFTKVPMLYFVVSDGYPAASRYGGMPGIQDTRKAVTEVTKMDFFPVQIGIGGGISPDIQKMMFDDFVNYSTSKQMVEDLRKLLLKRAHRFMGV